MPENTLYVEGSVLTRLMMGTARTRAGPRQPSHYIQEHPEAVIWRTLVNAVSAAYGAGGFPCLPVIVPLACRSRDDAAHLPGLGRATGVIEGFDALCEVIEKRLGTFEAIAISSVVDVPEDVQRAYFMGDGESIRSAGSRRC